MKNHLTMQRTMLKASAGALLATLIASLPFGIRAQAGVIQSELTGDIRKENPDDLFVYVEITFDDNSNTAEWLVDLDSPLHPDIKLDEFYFNLDVDADSVEFDDFTPTDWSVSPDVSVQGAGGVTFKFEASGEPKGTDVTNAQDLSFTATLNSGSWTDAIFLNAGDAESNDAGSGQLGAHLQSLEPKGEKSGFAFGDYSGSTDGPTPGQVPEPATFVIWTLLGTFGFGFRQWRRVHA